MTTSLYIPFTDFEVNNEDGQKILYENLVQSGPAYKLIVHESPSWLETRDKMPRGDMVEILTQKKADDYIKMVNEFFSPISENIPRKTYLVDGRESPIENLTIDHRRALSYILIAHDYKARIYEDDIMREKYVLSHSLMNTNKKEGKDIFSEEAINRVQFVETLIGGYKIESIPTLSVNKDPRIFHDLMDLLDREEIKLLSEKNQLFGMPKVIKDILIRDIRERTTQIVKSEYLPYLIGGVALTLSFHPDLSYIEKILSFLSPLAVKILGKYDFREYAPPIQDPQLFVYGKANTFSFSYKPFNYDFKILIPKSLE